MSTSMSERDGAIEDIIFHENPISGGQAVKYFPTKRRSDFDRSFCCDASVPENDDLRNILS